MGRSELIDRIRELETRLETLKADWNSLNESVREAQSINEHQAACIAQLESKIDELEAGIVIKGWKCSACGVFNGEEKERRSECRSCGLARR